MLELMVLVAGNPEELLKEATLASEKVLTSFMFEIQWLQLGFNSLM
jgi:hypothetical protein